MIILITATVKLCRYVLFVSGDLISDFDGPNLVHCKKKVFVGI